MGGEGWVSGSGMGIESREERLGAKLGVERHTKMEKPRRRGNRV